MARLVQLLHHSLAHFHMHSIGLSLQIRDQNWDNFFSFFFKDLISKDKDTNGEDTKRDRRERPS